MADLHGCTILFLACLASIILVRAMFRKSRSKARLPPSPRALPIIGHLHLLSGAAHQAFHKLSSHYGPLIHLYLGSVPCVVVSSAEMAKDFLRTHETSFLNRPEFTAVKHLSYPSASFSFAPYGPYWKFMKKLCMSQLLSGKTLDQLLPIRHEEMRRLVKLMLKKAEAKEEVEVGVEFQKITNNIISRMTMSQKCSEDDNEADEIRKLVKEGNAIVGEFNLSDSIWFFKNIDLQGFWRRCNKVHKKFDSMMERIINQHEEERKEVNGIRGEKVKDLLDVLLDISEDKSKEIRLTRENIKAFILEIFVAGTDTSAITTEWALSELINHPKIMRKAREEIDTVVGKTRLVEESDIGNLPYIQAIVKETLRLHPTGPLIIRVATENCTINGYNIAKKTRLFVNVWSTNRDPKHWESPHEFKPERFLVEQGRGNNQFDVRGQHFHLLSFGSGRRACPGATLAMQVVHTSLALMIQCFDWKVGGKDGTVDMEEGSGLTLPRACPLICVPVPRFSPLPM